MHRRLLTLTLRDNVAIALAGAAGAAMGFVLFHDAMALNGWLAAIGGGAWAAAFATLFCGYRLRDRNASTRIALDNISQGLCMFDGKERLAVCNAPYRHLYNQPESSTAVGARLVHLQPSRAASGTFAG